MTKINLARWIPILGISFTAIFAAPKEIPTTQASKEMLLSLKEISGKVLEAKCWEDKQGSACVIIWGKNNQGGGEMKGNSELVAAKFLKVSGGYKKVWQIRDFTNKQLQWVAYDSSSLKVFDLDGDGIAETRFFYFIVQDGLDPYQLKYMLHVGDKKYAIRGVIPMESSALSKYEKTLDPLFNSLPKNFSDFALADWDNHVSPILKELKDDDDGEPLNQ